MSVQSERQRVEAAGKRDANSDMSLTHIPFVHVN